jgi:hypothetical protein
VHDRNSIEIWYAVPNGDAVRTPTKMAPHTRLISNSVPGAAEGGSRGFQRVTRVGAGGLRRGTPEISRNADEAAARPPRRRWLLTGKLTPLANHHRARRQRPPTMGQPHHVYARSEMRPPVQGDHMPTRSHALQLPAQHLPSRHVEHGQRNLSTILRHRAHGFGEGVSLR